MRGSKPYEQFLQTPTGDDTPSQREKIIVLGPTWKQKGLFSKYRMLVLTDAPRLLYVDPNEMELKGEIPWTDEQPVEFVTIDSKHFDIVSPGDKDRAYHFMVADSSNTTVSAWADAINSAVDNQRRKLLSSAASASDEVDKVMSTRSKRAHSAKLLFGSIDS